jgi:hypothetical protein
MKGSQYLVRPAPNSLQTPAKEKAIEKEATLFLSKKYKINARSNNGMKVSIKVLGIQYLAKLTTCLVNARSSLKDLRDLIQKIGSKISSDREARADKFLP